MSQSESREASKPLWAVHVRGPDDVVAVPSYEDAIRLSDGLNWWWAVQPITENDPIISAVPILWNHTPEHHAEETAKLGTRGYDYRVFTAEEVEKLKMRAFEARIAKSTPSPLQAREKR